MAKSNTRKAKKRDSKNAAAAMATESTAQSKRPFAICAGSNGATLLSESLEDAAIGLEALGIAWQDRAKKIGVDGQSVSGDAILSAYMRFGEARGRIHDVLHQGVLDRGDGVGRAWMLSVIDALDSVVNELNAHDATMTDLATELARAARLNRLTNRLRAAQREIAYGHIVAAETGGEPANVESPKEIGPTHSIDFRSVNWYGTVYSFSGNQAACIKVWWEHWRQNTPDVSDDAVLETAEVTSRLRALFAGHPAWGAMIVEGATKGTHQLAAQPKN